MSERRGYVPPSEGDENNHAGSFDAILGPDRLRFEPRNSIDPAKRTPPRGSKVAQGPWGSGEGNVPFRGNTAMYDQIGAKTSETANGQERPERGEAPIENRIPKPQPRENVFRADDLAQTGVDSVKKGRKTLETLLRQIPSENYTNNLNIRQAETALQKEIMQLDAFSRRQGLSPEMTNAIAVQLESAEALLSTLAKYKEMSTKSDKNPAAVAPRQPRPLSPMRQQTPVQKGWGARLAGGVKRLFSR